MRLSCFSLWHVTVGWFSLWKLQQCQPWITYLLPIVLPTVVLFEVWIINTLYVFDIYYYFYFTFQSIKYFVIFNIEWLFFLRLASSTCRRPLKFGTLGKCPVCSQYSTNITRCIMYLHNELYSLKKNLVGFELANIIN